MGEGNSEVGLCQKRARILRFDGPERPKKLKQREGDLGESKLLAGADAWAAAEGDVFPAKRPFCQHKRSICLDGVDDNDDEEEEEEEEGMEREREGKKKKPRT